MIFALTKSGGNFSLITSVDGGVSFQVQASFPSTYTESSGGLLAVTPANPNTLMAVLLSSNSTPYLLKGTLSGSTWNWSLLATGKTGSFPMDNGQGYFDLVLVHNSGAAWGFMRGNNWPLFGVAVALLGAVLAALRARRRRASP